MLFPGGGGPDMRIVSMVLGAVLVFQAGIAFPFDPIGRIAIRVPIVERVLDNGLRVVISEDHAVPVVAVSITYDAGAIRERPGRTGLAHLFLHLQTGEISRLIHGYGGDANGRLGKDRMNYYECLPSAQLETALALEADRMKNPVIDERTFKNTVDFLKEENNNRYENNPLERNREAIEELAFTNFAYRHSQYGSSEDLSVLTLEDAREFQKTYYTPSHAVLTIVGDVTLDAAMSLVTKHFAGIPGGNRPEPVDLSEPENAGEKRRTLVDPQNRTPHIDIAYRIPPGLSADGVKLHALASIFNNSVRAGEHMVLRRREALYVWAFVVENRGPGLLWIVCRVAPGRSPEEVEKSIEREIERLKTRLVDDWEIEMAVNSAYRELLGSLSGVMNKAVQLGAYAVSYGDPGLINKRADMFSELKAEDIQSVARRYLVPENRSVLISLPESGDFAMKTKRGRR